MIQLLLNADLFAPEARGLRSLAVAAGKILWIGEEPPDLPAEMISEEVDLAGRRVVPGLIDGHVHITGGGGEAGPASRVPALGASRYTRCGVTSVVGLLGTDDLTRTTGDLVTQSRGLVEEGLSAWCYTGGYHFPPATLTGSVRGDIVFIDRVIGVGELALSDHRSSQPSLDELLRIASEAHVAGLMTGKAGTVHLHLGDGERGLDLVRRAVAGSELPARVFHPTHVNRRQALFEEALELAAQGSTIDITAFPVAGGDGWPADVALARFLDTGLPSDRITVSSDGGGCLPVFDADGRVTEMGVGDPSALIDCLARLLDSGRSLGEILPAFTANVADLLRLPGKGRIAVGGDADLLVLDAEGGAFDVMANGEWHMRGAEVLRRGTFEVDE